MLPLTSFPNNFHSCMKVFFHKKLYRVDFDHFFATDTFFIFRFKIISFGKIKREREKRGREGGWGERLMERGEGGGGGWEEEAPRCRKC